MTQDGEGRSNQKLRTRRAIVDACRGLMRSGAMVTMPEVAGLALVSEATAYRYFPDVVSLITEGLAGLWPSPAEALAPVAESRDPVERIGFACEFLGRGVLAYQGSVRVMIAATIVSPDSVPRRPGIRFGLIDEALDPVVADADAPWLARLKHDLTAVVSAEALFSLIDLGRLDPDAAIASLARTARTITAAAMREAGVRAPRRPATGRRAPSAARPGA
jgi:AcrR family transcriptional regulator